MGAMLIIEGAERADAIDVITVDLKDRRPSHLWQSAPGTVVDTWEGSRVALALGLVAALPSGQMMRCFIPHYAIRLRQGPVALVDVAFCFECHNALRIPVRGGAGSSDLIGFDATSAPARELLDLLRSSAAATR
jgi:hypothetical protein